jgi:adenine-specific DNA-methyltransferase
MADELDGLLARVDDPALRADLRAHIDRIRAKRSFGLVFESHLPERVRLPEHPIRPGANVARRDDPTSATFQVLRARGGKATVRAVRHPDGSRLSAEEAAEVVDEELPVADLVVIADFGEPIYPGLRTLDSIDRGGDKPAHVVIKGENHHVLQALQFSHAGKVDCIYIDPPYNTGARDWKYDNRYVDDTDAYRHSKWLAFIERRLLLAKELLNLERSVLIVTIDEKEYLRLGMLLEQLFPGDRTTMVTSSINNAGVTRTGTFGRAAEYVYVVQLGASEVVPLPLGDEWNPVRTKNKATIRWNLLLRSGTQTERAVSQIRFYPLFVADTPDGPVLHSVGEPFLGDDLTEVPCPEGTVAVWPIRSDGSEGVWQVARETLLDLHREGFVQLGRWRGEDTTPYYLKSGEVKKVRDGTFPVVGRRADGSVIVDASDYESRFVPTDVWRITSHDAGNSGSRLIDRFVPGRKFPFPKSLYAVEDAIRFFVADNPDAIVLDFFGGSGTTAHAVARLNRQDGGRRQSIVVTNNEVSAAEADALRKRGFRPGDPEWEALGIFEHVTRPRITAAVTGLTPEGEPVKGDYKFTDEFPMAEGFEENVAFAELVYLDPDDVELDLTFASVAPLLWLRAGAQGPVIDECLDAAGRRKPYAWTDRYGVLFNPDRWRTFVEMLPESATTAFVVTDSQAIFAGVAAELPDHLDVVRLYENYLTTFRINEGLG